MTCSLLVKFIRAIKKRFHHCRPYATNLKRKQMLDSWAIIEQLEHQADIRHYSQDTVRPSEQRLKQWATAEWIEYQAWIFNRDFITLHTWDSLHHQALDMTAPPLISVLIPTYNTDPEILRECIESVKFQTYPYWEICIADDGSTNPSTKNVLQQFANNDQRINVEYSPKNQGICSASNRALRMSSGSYIAFLDHDDRLAVNALSCVAEAISSNCQAGVIYSDRDMLNAQGYRFMHLFKPGYSPELLLSMNYMFHLMVYRKDIIDRVGGVREEFEGSQDYDLILRVSELNPVIHHIPKVLYHWRQSNISISLEHDAKKYVYASGIDALHQTLIRRNLKGSVEEIPNLQRGHYRVKLDPPQQQTVAHFKIDKALPVKAYANYIEKCVLSVTDQEFICFTTTGIKALETDYQSPFQEMVSWFQIAEIGMATGKIITPQKNIVHAGYIQRLGLEPLAIFSGGHDSNPGYIASTAVVRNVSMPHPYCFAVRRSLWHDLGGLDHSFEGPYALVDFANRASQSGMRTVYTPFAKFITDGNYNCEWGQRDQKIYQRKWHIMLRQGDLFYNRNLTLDLNDMGLDLKPLANETQP